MVHLFEGFAGYGGASFGLARSGYQFDVVGFSEVDPDAVELYQHNFPGIHNYGDIASIDPEELPYFNFFTGGFPCQPFSTIGSMQGELDPRGTLFGEIIRICEARHPQCILLENVKGLTLGKHRPTFEKILRELHRIGYDTRHCILNSKDYGIPQNRPRLWIFAYFGQLPEGFEMVPPVLPLEHFLHEFLDNNPDPELYRTPEQVAHLHEVHGVPRFDVQVPACFDIYNHRFREDGICMAVTPPEHNVVRIVEPSVNGVERVRKLSIDEHFRLMGFHIDGNDREITFPDTLNYTKLGRRAGNGWDVNLVGILMNHIFNQIPPLPDRPAVDGGVQ